MKWRNIKGKRQDEARIRKDGDIRAFKKFAWLPVNIDGDTVWLEKYYRIEKWLTVPKMWFSFGNSKVWD